MLNPSLSIGAFQERLTRTGRVQIGDFFQLRQADALELCLREQVPWTLAYRSAGESRTLSNESYSKLPLADREQLRDSVIREARQGFAFIYESFMMVTAYLEQRVPDLLLNRLLEYLNSPPFLDFARSLTGETRIIKADAQATCYRGGHFLKYHDDLQEDQGRLYAFVLNLTRRWQADWGGLLHFLDAEGGVTETFMPRFNSLSLFRVPAPHCVSLVAPFAEAGRYSIAGWLRS